MDEEAIKAFNLGFGYAKQIARDFLLGYGVPKEVVERLMEEMPVGTRPIEVGDWVETPDGSYVEVKEVVDQLIVEFVGEDGGAVAYDRKELTLAKEEPAKEPEAYEAPNEAELSADEALKRLKDSGKR